MKILYIANVRIPTPRAHGLQIMSMCEQFAALGHTVELIVPRKFHRGGGTPDPFSYYGIKRNFTIRRILALDLLGLTERFGRFLYWVDLVSFLLRLSFLRVGGKKREDILMYTRDPTLLFPFRSSYDSCVELHEIPESINGLWRRGLARANAIVALTKLLKDDLMALGFSGENILVAPDGVDVNASKSALSTVEARRTNVLPPDTPIVLYTGHLYGWKGASTLLQAARELPSVHFLLVGGIDPELSAFKKEYETVSNVELRPFEQHEKIAGYLAAGTILALPTSAQGRWGSRYTSPLKLFEYMASGKPIVASDLPSLREVLSEKNAFLVKPDDPRALAEGIRFALAHPEEAARRAAQAREDVKRYTWEMRAEKILSFIGAK
jgi:glycosyltransferase involved in cell wall biosynthesis